MADAQMIQPEAPDKTVAFFFSDGMRKVTVLGPALALAECAGIAALFTGKMSEGTFESFVIGVLTWGGGIFAGANVLEHIAKAVLTQRGL